MMTTDVERVDEVYAGWNARDMGRVLAHLTPDIVWEGPGRPASGSDTFGRTETAQRVAATGSAWEGWQALPERRLQGDGVVLVLGALVREADGGRVPFRHLWDLREDGVCRLREQLDTSALLHVLAAA